MPDRYEIELFDTDAPAEIARKLAQTMAVVHEQQCAAMVKFRGQPYVAIVPPDAGLAWARAGESQRLSRIATESAGLGHVIPDRPGSAVDQDRS